jgi:hypothetical protein
MAADGQSAADAELGTLYRGCRLLGLLLYWGLGPYETALFRVPPAFFIM